MTYESHRAFGDVLYTPQGPFVPPLAGDVLPTPRQVPGKEYADKPNQDFTGTPSPEQVLLWDGVGGVANGFNYVGTRPLDVLARQVDALGNFLDELYLEVTSDGSYLLFSTVGDAVAPVRYEAPVTGTMGIWATALEIDCHGVRDLGGLEVWGPEQVSDSNMYSLADDPVNPDTGFRTSVWFFDGMSSLPMWTATDIALAIDRPDLEADIDVDAMMTFGERLLFSIEPIDVFNGGEIWEWDGSGLARFLRHGGHVWDSSFGATVGDIDALEAVSTTPDIVPEPASVWLLGVGMLGLIACGRRRR